MRVYVGGRKRICKGFSIGAFVPVKGEMALVIAGLAGIAYAIWLFAKGVFGMIDMAVGHVDRNLAKRAAAKEPDPNEKARALVNLLQGRRLRR